MLSEAAPPSVTPEMLGEAAAHMRLSEGFATDQTSEVEAAFRAALAHVERTLGLCLAPRRFVWRTRMEGAEIDAPISPVRAVVSATELVRGAPTRALDLSLFALDATATRSRLGKHLARSLSVEIEFEAGFGDEWAATPADLRRAVLMLAAHYFDNRGEVGERTFRVPHGVAALLRPWRPIRLGTGS